MGKVKIVQMLAAPNDSAYQGALLGLGSDGVIYRAENDSKWHVYFPCAFAEEEEAPNAKVTGSPALSASPCGLPGYASADGRSAR